MGHDRLMRFAERSAPDRAAAQIQAWTGDQFAGRADEAMRIYAQAMGYSRYAGTARAVTARRHVTNEGFRARAAVLEDGTLVGFGYGYTTLPGQWWHDLVRKALPAQSGPQWLENAFELSELHVLPSFQGQGVGRRLLIDLTASLPHRTVLLSTPDADTIAFHLYHRVGFRDLRRGYLFPGDARPFAVLGAHLPLVRS